LIYQVPNISSLLLFKCHLKLLALFDKWIRNFSTTVPHSLVPCRKWWRAGHCGPFESDAIFLYLPIVLHAGSCQN
jgi:hypothetical protein